MNPLTRLVVARHGNTFLQEEPSRRVGGRTDLPLVPSGEAQARALGEALRAAGFNFTHIYAGPLKRTQQTARLTQLSGGFEAPIQTLDFLREIDYGPDENQPEAVVKARLGTAALEAWEKACCVPPGWIVDGAALIEAWKNLAQRLLEEAPGKDALVVTSSGIARFAGALTGSLEDFGRKYGFKMATGGYSVLVSDGNRWRVERWNQRALSYRL